MVSVDMMGPYPKTYSAKTTSVVVTGTFTKWVEAFPIGDSKTPMVACWTSRFLAATDIRGPF